MNYARIIPQDVANGPGVRVSLFVSGCNNECDGCFNKDIWDFTYGDEYTDKTNNYILSQLEDDKISGLSILGGDPMWQDNDGLAALNSLCVSTKCFHKDIWLWTGFEWEYLLELASDPFDERSILLMYLLRAVDVVVDGPFVQELADPSLVFRGSSNQRIIDVKASLKKGEVVLMEEYYEANCQV